MVLVLIKKYPQRLAHSNNTVTSYDPGMIGETLHVHFPPAFIPTSQTEDMRLSESKSSAYGHQTWPFDSLERQSQFLVEKKKCSKFIKFSQFYTTWSMTV